MSLARRIKYLKSTLISTARFEYYINSLKDIEEEDSSSDFVDSSNDSASQLTFTQLIKSKILESALLSIFSNNSEIN